MNNDNNQNINGDVQLNNNPTVVPIPPVEIPNVQPPIEQQNPVQSVNVENNQVQTVTTPTMVNPIPTEIPVQNEPQINVQTIETPTPNIQQPVNIENSQVQNEQQVSEEQSVSEPVKEEPKPVVSALDLSIKKKDTIKKVIPVEDVKVEEEEETYKKSSLRDYVPKEIDPKVRKRNNILITLLFIFLFAFVMGIPYINDYLDSLNKTEELSEIEKRAREIEAEQNKQKEQEQKEVEKQTQEEAALTKMTCTLVTPASETVAYTKTTVQEFEYNPSNQVVKSGMKNTYTFTVPDESYATLKQKCDADSLKFVGKDGYTFTCSYTDLEVVIGNEFDLNLFKPINDETSIITANATLNEDATALKQRLITSGYTCE